MSPDLLQQFGPRFVTALTVALVFGSLWLINRERYLAVWAGAWAIWALRYAHGMAAGSQPTTALLPLLAIATATATLWGARALNRDALPRAWITLAALDLGWLLVETITGRPLTVAGTSGATHWLLLATGLIWSGALFLRSRVITGVERAAAGGGLVVLGVIQVVSPWAPAAADPISALVSMTAQLSFGIGTLMAYFRRATLESSALHRRLEEALTTALSGHIPICMHCKSVRDTSGAWERLESYITRRTRASLSHGICETCLAVHYPDVK
jgi:hypothetical protein